MTQLRAGRELIGTNQLLNNRSSHCFLKRSQRINDRAVARVSGVSDHVGHAVADCGGILGTGRRQYSGSHDVVLLHHAVGNGLKTHRLDTVNVHPTKVFVEIAQEDIRAGFSRFRLHDPDKIIVKIIPVGVPGLGGQTRVVWPVVINVIALADRILVHNLGIVMFVAGRRHRIISRKSLALCCVGTNGQQARQEQDDGPAFKLNRQNDCHFHFRSATLWSSSSYQFDILDLEPFLSRMGELLYPSSASRASLDEWYQP